MEILVFDKLWLSCGTVEKGMIRTAAHSAPNVDHLERFNTPVQSQNQFFSRVQRKMMEMFIKNDLHPFCIQDRKMAV